MKYLYKGQIVTADSKEEAKKIVAKSTTPYFIELKNASNKDEKTFAKLLDKIKSLSTFSGDTASFREEKDFELIKSLLKEKKIAFKATDSSKYIFSEKDVELLKSNGFKRYADGDDEYGEAYTKKNFILKGLYADIKVYKDKFVASVESPEGVDTVSCLDNFDFNANGYYVGDKFKKFNSVKECLKYLDKYEGLIKNLLDFAKKSEDSIKSYQKKISTI